MTTPAPSTDTTTTNAGQAFKIGVTYSSTANINQAYGSLGAFPYMTADNRPDEANLADLYLKVWQDSTTYTAIKNGWSVVTGTAATGLNGFSNQMSGVSDPWSDYRFAILNKIDLSAYAQQHASKFTFAAVADTAVTAGYYNDHFVGYCIFQDSKGGVCAEATVTTTWDSYIDFNKPTLAPTFSFAAARFKTGAAILTIATATDTSKTPVALVTAETAKTSVTALSTASASELVATDGFVGTAELFGTSRIASQTDLQLGIPTTASFACTAAGASTCGVSSVEYKASLAATNLDYVPTGQSGFRMIGAGASYKAGAMWTYLWGWVPTTNTSLQTNSHDLTFESGVKHISWAATRDLVVASGANPGDGQNGNCATGGCLTGSGKCGASCRGTVAAAAIQARTAKDLTVTRVAMSGSSLVASAAAAIVAASLAF